MDNIDERQHHRWMLILPRMVGGSRGDREYLLFVQAVVFHQNVTRSPGSPGPLIIPFLYTCVFLKMWSYSSLHLFPSLTKMKERPLPLTR